MLFNVCVFVLLWSWVRLQAAAWCIDEPTQPFSFSVFTMQDSTGKWVAEVELDEGADDPQLNGGWQVEVNKSTTDNRGLQQVVLMKSLTKIEDRGPGIHCDYQLFPDIGYYKLHTVAKTWSDAEAVCISEGGHLLVLNSEAESKIIQQLYARHPDLGGPNVASFIGFHDKVTEGQFVTIFDEPLNATGFTRWSTIGSQPDNAGPLGEDCGSVHRNGGLNDFPCDVTVPFFCEKKIPGSKKKEARERRRICREEDTENLDAEMKALEAKAQKEADEAKAQKEADEAKAHKEADEEKAQKEADEAKAHKEADEAKAHKEADEAKAQKEADKAKTDKEAADAKAQKEADEAKTQRDADKAKAQKEADEAKAQKDADKAKAQKEADEAKAQKEADEAKAQKEADEAKAQKKAADAKAQKEADEAKAQKKATDAKAQKEADEAKAQKEADEAKAQKEAGEAKAQKEADEAKAQKEADELKAQKEADEAKKKTESENDDVDDKYEVNIPDKDIDVRMKDDQTEYILKAEEEKILKIDYVKP